MPDPARETCERCFRPINGKDPGDQLMHGDGYCFDRRTERIAELEEVIESLADAANEYERERDAARAKLAEAEADRAPLLESVKASKRAADVLRAECDGLRARLAELHDWLAYYVCPHCGNMGLELYHHSPERSQWRCPDCRAWDKPGAKFPTLKAMNARLAEAEALLRDGGAVRPSEWLARRDAFLESSPPHPDLIEREAREDRP